jgi:hypothetical protein
LDQSASLYGTNTTLNTNNQIVSPVISPTQNGELVVHLSMAENGELDPETERGWLKPSNWSYPGLHYYIQTNAAAISGTTTNLIGGLVDPYWTFISSFKSGVVSLPAVRVTNMRVGRIRFGTP